MLRSLACDEMMLLAQLFAFAGEKLKSFCRALFSLLLLLPLLLPLLQVVVVSMVEAVATTESETRTKTKTMIVYQKVKFVQLAVVFVIILNPRRLK